MERGLRNPAEDVKKALKSLITVKEVEYRKKKYKNGKNIKDSEMIFPFTAIVNQEDMKLGLILNVIYPSIGGLLIMGEKGTAKSTAVRALADLLPEIEVIKGCRFNCAPEGP